MKIPGIIFLSLFGIISVVHLVFCFLESEKYRKITKPFCVLFLGIAAAFLLPNYPLVYIGAFLGVVGDIFLIKKEKFVLFAIGAVFFTAGHICYFTQMVKLLPYVVPWYSYLILAFVLAGFTFGLYPITKKTFGTKALCGNFYMPFLVVMLALSIAFTVSNRTTYGIPIICGYVCFLFSDGFLIYTTFIKDIKRRDFYIMASYLFAESLIVSGFVLFLF